MQRFKTSNSMTYDCSVESLWEIVSSPNYLNNVHPFCKENPTIEWSNDHHEDKIVYLNNRYYIRKFVSWKFSDPLIVNKFGFLEPEINGKKIIPDLILVPIVAFDKFKNRLGYGKGYYDRILRKYVLKNPKIITIGLAFSFQKYKKIPISKFDVKLNYILTEKGLY